MLASMRTESLHLVSVLCLIAPLAARAFIFVESSSVASCLHAPTFCDRSARAMSHPAGTAAAGEPEELSGPEHQFIVVCGDEVQLQVVCSLLQGLLHMPQSQWLFVDSARLSSNSGTTRGAFITAEKKLTWYDAVVSSGWLHGDPLQYKELGW